MTVCCLAVHTATIRMAFAMARDNNCNGEQIATVHPEDQDADRPGGDHRPARDTDPRREHRQQQIFTVITSIGIIMIYMAYLLVTVPMLAQAAAG